MPILLSIEPDETLDDVHDRTTESPVFIVDALTVSVQAGPGVVMVTGAWQVAVPPGPITVMIKVVDAETGTFGRDPVDATVVTEPIL